MVKKFVIIGNNDGKKPYIPSFVEAELGNAVYPANRSEAFVQALVHRASAKVKRDEYMKNRAKYECKLVDLADVSCMFAYFDGETTYTYFVVDVEMKKPWTIMDVSGTGECVHYFAQDEAYHMVNAEYNFGEFVQGGE